jgi:hypothetical protein
MRRGRFAVLLVLSMAFAGCLGPSTASWGTDNGELDVQFSQESTTVTSGLGSETMKLTDLEAVGCSTDSGTGERSLTSFADDNADPTTITFTGYLAASNFYSSHPDTGGAKGLDFGVATSVAIQDMTFKEAENVLDGEGARIDIKNWDKPLTPETGAGSVDLDEIDRDSDTQWYILGLIPTSENIHDGLTALDEWHQAVTINGYLVQTNTSGSSTVGYYTNQGVDQDCNLAIGSNNYESAYVFVTSIELAEASISSNGESDDEWVHGDVAFIGRTGYLLFFLAFGIGGGFGAFILSKMFVLQGAKSTMKTLLGKAGMDTIKQVKQDVKSAKSSGLVSPTERKKEARKHAAKNNPQESKKDDSGPPLAAFDLDSVLSSGPSMGSTTEFGGGGSSVVETIESQEMAREIFEQSEVETPAWQAPSPMRSSAPPRQTHSSVTSSVTSSDPPTQPREHFTTSAPVSKKSAGPPKKKSVRKRKSPPAQVEQAREEPNPEPPKESRKTFDEPEEDFSDFSF